MTTTNINPTPLELKVREYFSSHGVAPKEYVGFEKTPQVPAERRAWMCEIKTDAVHYKRVVYAQSGAHAKRAEIEAYHENSAYSEHLEIRHDGKHLAISSFPVTKEYQIISSIGKKLDMSVVTSLDDVLKLLPELRKEVA